MATTLQRGSTGSQVKKLQNMLGQAGYQVDASGNYDDATAAAVQKYQQAQGLAGNGVFDNATLQKLYGTIQTNQQTQQQDQTQQQGQQQAQQQTGSASPDTIAKLQELGQGYKASDEVEAAKKTLQQTQGGRPGDYTSQYDTIINGLFDQIMNRGKFSYDVNGDALYNQYKDQYIKGGRMAMEDTMGRAANLTGGYGNSYAQQVGQQTYQDYMTRLADKVPELEERAYGRWADEGDRLRQQMNDAMARENQDYERWNDSYNRWRDQLEYDTNRADTLDQQGYNRWADERDYWNSRENTEYSRSQADREQSYDLTMSMLKMGIMPSEDALAKAGISIADATAIIKQLQQSAASKSGGRGGSGGSGKSGSDTTLKQVTDEQIDQAMKLYENNPDNVVAYLDRLEYQGYDVDYIINYLEKYGSKDGKASGKVSGSNLYKDENGTYKSGKQIYHRIG